MAKMDLHVGGIRHISMGMQTPNGPIKMWFVGEHLAVDPDRRLVYTESISDEDGNLVLPAAVGMPADHPHTTEVTIKLEQLGKNTQIMMTHAGIPADSPGATGWTMAFDKLTSYVEAISSPTS